MFSPAAVSFAPIFVQNCGGIKRKGTLGIDGVEVQQSRVEDRFIDDGWQIADGHKLTVDGRQLTAKTGGCRPLLWLKADR
jgi:hypothetical protein